MIREFVLQARKVAPNTKAQVAGYNCSEQQNQLFIVNSQSGWRSGKISHSVGFRSVDQTRTLSDRTAVIFSFHFIASLIKGIILQSLHHTLKRIHIKPKNSGFWHLGPKSSMPLGLNLR